MKKLVAILLFTIHYSLFTNCSAQIIFTVAGNGYDAGSTSGGYSGDGGQATDAELYTPWDVAFNKSGNMYISDASRIEIVIMSTGIINRFTSASIITAGFLALDDSGNIYIPDGAENIVYKANAITGTITAIAGLGGSINQGYFGDGGAATAALLDDPAGVALDDSTNIYISDFDNNVIRKVTVATGIITTVVGNGYGHWHGAGTWTGAYHGDGGPATASEMYGPSDIKLDTSGNIYIADERNNVVRKVTASTGIIATVAGNGIMGYYGDGGQATVAELWFPNGICLDKYGNIYISDANSVVRKVTVSTGIISTIAGNGYTIGGGIGGYSGDGGQATDAELDQPAGLNFDTLGNLYIADAWNNVIRKVTYDTNTVTGNNLIVKSEGLRVFPNPSSGVFTFQLSVIGIQHPVSIGVYNILGERVYSQFNINSSTFNIDLSSQPDGIYLYRLLTEKGELVGQGKVVIEK